MKVWKWVLIALAVIAVIGFTIPPLDNSCITHSYEKQNFCTERICTKCGKITTLTSLSHSLNALSCSEAECATCGKVVSGVYHKYEAIPCTNKELCSVCKHVRTVGIESHNRTTVTDGCTKYTVCMDCGKQYGSFASHDWFSKNCEESISCKLCGSTDAPSHLRGHSYTTMSYMFDLPEVCSLCGKWSFPPLTVETACVYLGLLMSIAAFIFIFINREGIRVREGRFFCTVTPDSQLREKGTEDEYS